MHLSDSWDDILARRAGGASTMPDSWDTITARKSDEVKSRDSISRIGLALLALSLILMATGRKGKS